MTDQELLSRIVEDLLDVMATMVLPEAQQKRFSRYARELAKRDLSGYSHSSECTCSECMERFDIDSLFDGDPPPFP